MHCPFFGEKIWSRIKWHAINRGYTCSAPGAAPPGASHWDSAGYAHRVRESPGRRSTVRSTEVEGLYVTEWEVLEENSFQSHHLLKLGGFRNDANFWSTEVKCFSNKVDEKFWSIWNIKKLLKKNNEIPPEKYELKLVRFCWPIPNMINVGCFFRQTQHKTCFIGLIC